MSADGADRDIGDSGAGGDDAEDIRPHMDQLIRELLHFFRANRKLTSAMDSGLKIRIMELASLLNRSEVLLRRWEQCERLPPRRQESARNRYWDARELLLHCLEYMTIEFEAHAPFIYHQGSLKVVYDRLVFHASRTLSALAIIEVGSGHPAEKRSLVAHQCACVITVGRMEAKEARSSRDCAVSGFLAGAYDQWSRARRK